MGSLSKRFANAVTLAGIMIVMLSGCASVATRDRLPGGSQGETSASDTVSAAETCDQMSLALSDVFNAFSGKRKDTLTHEEYVALTSSGAEKIAAVQVDPGTDLAQIIWDFQAEVASFEPSADGAVFDPGRNEFFNTSEQPVGQQCRAVGHELRIYGNGG